MDNELYKRVQELERRIDDIEEQLEPLEYPKIPTYLLLVRRDSLEEEIAAGFIALTPELQTTVYTVAPLPVDMKENNVDQVRCSLYLDMLYTVCCEAATQKMIVQTIVYDLGFCHGDSLLQLPGIDSPKLKKRANNIINEMKNTGVLLTSPYSIHSKLYNIAKDQLMHTLGKEMRRLSTHGT